MTGARSRQAEAFAADNYFIVRALPAEHDDPLYPRFSTAAEGPMVTPQDGVPARFVARAISVVDPSRSTDRPVLHFENIRASVSVTRSRVVFFCRDYDKGGGFGFFLGGLGFLVALISWVVRRIRAGSRSRGLTLVGQIWRTELTGVEHDRSEVMLITTSPQSGRPLLMIVEFADVFAASQFAAAIGPIPAGPAPPRGGPSAHQPPPPGSPPPPVR